jgi:hypothetical protein
MRQSTHLLLLRVVHSLLQLRNVPELPLGDRHMPAEAVRDIQDRAAQCRYLRLPVGTMSVPQTAGRHMSAPSAGTDGGVQSAQGLPYGLGLGPTGPVG